MVGDAAMTMELCERVLKRGVFAQGIRPPTVPEDSSRLRLTVMASHRPAELQRAARLIGAVARELGLVDGIREDGHETEDWVELERAA
jgi:7-keto-8-aminopelargonate synthetase-like enzyme